MWCGLQNAVGQGLAAIERRLDTAAEQSVASDPHTVLGVIKENGINVDAMENVLFEGGEGACANIQIEAELSTEAIARIEEASGDVLSVNMHEIG